MFVNLCSNILKRLLHKFYSSNRKTVSASTLPRPHNRQFSAGDGPLETDKTPVPEDTSKQTISRSSNTRDRETATPGGKLNITGTGSQTEQVQLIVR